MAPTRSPHVSPLGRAIRKYGASAFVIGSFVAYAIHERIAPHDHSTAEVAVPTLTTSTQPGVAPSPTAQPTLALVVAPTTVPTTVPTTSSPAVPTDAPTPTSLPTDAPTPSPAAATTALTLRYRDGHYTGQIADAYWGDVQVEATIQNGRITDVQFLDYPHDRRTSVRINSQAVPDLTTESIQAQSAAVDLITGATFDQPCLRPIAHLSVATGQFMKQTRTLMGMPIAVEVVDAFTPHIFDTVFDYFAYIDATFSPFKPDSEVTHINQRRLTLHAASRDVQVIWALAEQTRRQTNGYFDIAHDGQCDPSGIVKGWSIRNAARIIRDAGYHNFAVVAGGDMEVGGHSCPGQAWRVGIQNPFNLGEIVKVLEVSERGVATSGTYLQGAHIYNPHGDTEPMDEIVSVTVIAPNIYEADRFATAAFAMGRAGINFIEHLAECEGYLIDRERRATATSGFQRYVVDA